MRRADNERRILLLFVGTAVAVAIHAPAAMAQSCYLLTYGCEGGQANHYAYQRGDAIGLPSHSSCNYCVPMIEGGAYPCHDQCEISLLPSMMKAALRSAVAAAMDGDVQTVLALSPLLGDRVRYYPQRQALQIMGCSDDAVIANLSLPSSLVAAAARLLETQHADVAVASAR